jgi:hypothetical protein
MSQRELRGRRVDIVSEEMDLGSREISPDLEELPIEIARFRPDINKANNEARDSQSGLNVEVPDKQVDSSGKDNSKSDKLSSSEINMIMKMLQQLLQRSDEQLRELKEGQKKSDQQFQGLIEVFKQTQEEIKEEQKQCVQELKDNASEASRQLREQDRPIEQQANSEPSRVQKEVRQIEQEVGIVSERSTKENHESSLGFVENATVCVVETLRPRSDKELGSKFTKKADVTCHSIDTYEVAAKEKHSNVDPKDLKGKDSRTIVKRSKTIKVAQKPQLFELSNKISPSFTKRPGKCRLLEYQCQANSGQFSRSFSRPVPFALRPAVRLQIQNLIKEGLIKEICQKSPDEPLREGLPSTILKADAKVRKKAKKRKSQRGKVKIKRQIGGQVLAKHQPVSNARKANTKRKEKVDSRKFRRRKVKFKWQCQIRDWVSQKSTSLGC